MSDKIKPHHLARKAILYVRQSSTHQVQHNRESAALQYAMRDHLTALGWRTIETIDDDLGRRARLEGAQRSDRPQGQFNRSPAQPNREQPRRAAQPRAEGRGPHGEARDERH